MVMERKREREMFSHHLRFSSNPRESPRRKQIVFDKPPCFVLPSWRVSLHSRYTIIRSKTRFFFLTLPFPLFLPGRHALLLLTCLSQKALQTSSECLVLYFMFYKEDQGLFARSVYLHACNCRCAFDYHAKCPPPDTVHVYFCICVLHCLRVYTEEYVKIYK